MMNKSTADAQMLTAEWVRARFAPRPADSHKGTYGRLLTVCGKYGMAGAALMCASAALHSGVGLLDAAVPRSVYPLIASALPEAIFTPVAETAAGGFSVAATADLLGRLSCADAAVIGCGLGTEADAATVVRRLLRERRCPTVLDADGINVISPHILTEETVAFPLILTPHPGEMARLMQMPVSEVQAHREEFASRFAEQYGVVTVLKGHRTVIAAPGQPLLVNPTGNPGMATGGSGDVLAGMIGALLAQGMDARDAAACGVYLHGAAGDLAAAKHSQHAMLPSDMIGELGNLFLNMEK